MHTFKEFLNESNEFSIHEHIPGSMWRIKHKDNKGVYFGQLKKENKKWRAEIRHGETGDLARHAGIWNKKSDAIGEIHHHLSNSPYKDKI